MSCCHLVLHTSALSESPKKQRGSKAKWKAESSSIQTLFYIQIFRYFLYRNTYPTHPFHNCGVLKPSAHSVAACQLPHFSPETNGITCCCFSHGISLAQPPPQHQPVGSVSFPPGAKLLSSLPTPCCAGLVVFL